MNNKTIDAEVLCVGHIDFQALTDLLLKFDLQLTLIADQLDIPGSFWGDREAGLIGYQVYVRNDTPVHSVLHEAGHLIVMPEAKRAQVHTNASDCILEEDATCYLQILLADFLPEVGRERLMRDMDIWGYTFRLGSSKAWFYNDAEDARAFLQEKLGASSWIFLQNKKYPSEV